MIANVMHRKYAFLQFRSGFSCFSDFFRLGHSRRIRSNKLMEYYDLCFPERAKNPEKHEKPGVQN
jgi:hypothetical protein